jgi:tripartite-type tricarboxylate transporter receptor subunit TctC
MTHDDRLTEWTRRRWLTSALGVGASTSPLWSHAATAPSPNATWPNGPVRLVVGFPAGSSPDVMARLLAEPLAAALGKPIVVDNKPGAAGNLAADFVAKATDGHTIGLMPNGPLTSSEFLFSKLQYKASSFAPVTLVATAPLVLVASKKVTETHPQAFITALRNSGKGWNYGSVGIGSAGHLGMELLRDKVGFGSTHVPFQGAPQVLNALVAGDVQSALLPLGPTMPLARAGRLTAIAVSSDARSSLAPELPSLKEVGISGLNIEVWNAVLLPANAPADVTARLGDALGDIIRSADVRTKLFEQGWRAVGASPEALRQRIAADRALYSAIISARGLKMDE